MNQRVISRLWADLGLSVAVLAGMGLLLAFLGREPSAPVLPSAQSPMATLVTSPLSVPTIESPIASPTPAPAPETPTPALTLPEVAPDFTLERAGGGTLTLAEQLAQGPVVLVFFQRCG